MTWQFKKDHDLPSYVRIFRTSNDYSDAWIKNYTYPNYTPSGNVTPAQIQDWLKTYTGGFSVSSYQERSNGLDFQFGKNIGINNILFGMTVSHDYYRRVNPSARTRASISRNMFTSYLQDKLKIGDNFEITPGLRYIHSDDYTVKTAEEKIFPVRQFGQPFVRYVIHAVQAG